jgi:hypothetical protein
MVVPSLITGHINGPVTWREVAVLAIVVAVLYSASADTSIRANLVLLESLDCRNIAITLVDG